jgi:hypothetical protein
MMQAFPAAPGLNFRIIKLMAETDGRLKLVENSNTD